MGLLISQLFTTPTADPKLEACLVSDAAHITPGAHGEHVKKIQTALNQLSRGPGRENFNLDIDGSYGPKTAAAVKAYKNHPSRRILQPWQTSADDIVGKRTIKSLDTEMDILENESPAQDRFVSTTLAGAPHDHSKCPIGGFRQGPNGTVSFQVNHFGTPVNPKGGGRKINLGGEGETKYLGFEDFLPNFFPGPVRPLTSSLPDQCASDICLRDAPISKDGSLEKGKKEIMRIAQPGCRLTFCGDVARFRLSLLSLGTVIEHIVMADPRFPGTNSEALVIRMP
ncbi:putative peptidoglycan binding protein [Nitrosospira sp. Nsp5]|uniref:Peptidoglycan binding domain-containing protein n=1 Tax=Nitrosospira multiformis TaxID=1231 RepID=A0ABY0TKU7_9PROT|nr:MULTISPECIES: peptidoglycan-binding protein [Nitrosospira]PTR10022.1 putative peptidoglycan binding protein [Nitrosospira sp. Nsp5]SDQ99090.1 Putative peptidoglycan binding domain-containing protein [Nitrosospira multiformis]